MQNIIRATVFSALLLQLFAFVSCLNKISTISMSGRKRVTTFSELTQPDRCRRFVRRNSVHTLTCRQGSLRKLPSASDNNPADQCLQTQETIQNPEKEQQKPSSEMQSCKDMVDLCQPALKRASISMKVPLTGRVNSEAEKSEWLMQQLQLQRKEGEQLARQLGKAKMALAEERERRRAMEEEARCSRQEVKRLEKRLEKYRAEREKQEAEREALLRHVEQLEDSHFSQDQKATLSWQLNCARQEKICLREQLRKGQSQREAELQCELTRCTEVKYGLQQQLRAAGVGRLVLARQLQQSQQEARELRQSFQQAVTQSYEYQQLREKYRIMLVQFKQLREEMSLLQRSGSLCGLSVSQSLSWSD